MHILISLVLLFALKWLLQYIYDDILWSYQYTSRSKAGDMYYIILHDIAAAPFLITLIQKE